MNMEPDFKTDISLAQNARKKAYILNGLTVGAVVTTKSGRKYTGCNIKNGSDIEVFAEQVAIYKAISEGETEFDYIFVTAGKKNMAPEKYMPSKACVSFLKKYVSDDFKVYVLLEKNIEQYKI